ncbi:MAG: tRNA adenosine(34) deaminase TadA [Fretibacterium sp.]|nr:tRNA adenosine(34) deaminase TadA [Fretibacterium sp.]
MRQAVEEAQRALERGDVPVGALVVLNGEILGKGSNRKDTDPTAHAEVQALRRAAEKLGRWNLRGCVLYVTLEPCPMCAGACVNARVSRVVFGAADPRAGAGGSLYNILHDTRLNHRCEVCAGILSRECSGLLQEYFLMRRHRTNVKN